MTIGSIGRHLAAGAFVTSILVACGGEMGALGGAGGTGSLLGDFACPELRGGAMSANFEADAKANGTVRAFVTAAGDLAAIAARVEGEVGAACERMGHDLGIPAEQLAPQGNATKVSSACNAVSARVDAIMKTGASASIKAVVTPPECRVSANAEAECKGQCEGHLDPGYVKAHCDPGHLYGACDGTCTGQCAGACNGQCQGECQGQGQAKVAPGGAGAGASGRCEGHCKGTCEGSCSVDCHGKCSVDFKEPKCDVAVKAPTADAHCAGSCKAHADLSAQCTEGSVNVSATTNTGDMGKLAATLRANLPALVKAELAYGARLGGDVQELVRTGSELPSALGHLSARTGACVAAAANACVSAQASLHVSVQASASISAKAGVHGG